MATQGVSKPKEDSISKSSQITYERQRKVENYVKEKITKRNSNVYNSSLADQL